MGVDVLNGFDVGTDLPSTPNLDGLRESGVTFTNVWAAPVCGASRASLLSGKHGVNNGFATVTGVLSPDHTSFFNELKEKSSGAYVASAVGKWHIGAREDYQHPFSHGADDFMGITLSEVTDYFNWEKIENGSASMVSTYATSYFTDYAVNWINSQTKPWVMWLGHVAPHIPNHSPPEGMYTQNSLGSPGERYLAMIESLDFEIGRLMDAMTTDVLENTLIIFIGDNGTPKSKLQAYPDGHGKFTIYEGGIRVPMIISGSGVSRMGVKESALINESDLYATIVDMAMGAPTYQGGIYNSLSFAHMLTGEAGTQRKYNYMQVDEGGNNVDADVFTVRNEKYKMIQIVNGAQEFYDLSVDPYEFDNLLEGNLTAEQSEAKADLELEGEAIRNGWSCRDLIKNGNETGIDCGGGCGECTAGVAMPGIIQLAATPKTKWISGQLIIEFKDNLQFSEWIIQLYNIAGELIPISPVFKGNQALINMREMPQGIYVTGVTHALSQERLTNKILNSK